MTLLPFGVWPGRWPRAAMRRFAAAARRSNWLHGACNFAKAESRWPWARWPQVTAEAGRFADALKCADRAIAAADARVEANLAKSLRGQREQYRQGKPYRE